MHFLFEKIHLFLCFLNQILFIDQKDVCLYAKGGTFLECFIFRGACRFTTFKTCSEEHSLQLDHSKKILI